jgi:outer membrane protein OmpA-like peptidoglycan-associated protein
LRIIGHTDTRGTPESNLELSLARATAVLEWFASRGFPREQMAAEGLGEKRSAPDINADGTFDEEAGRGNRRVDIYVGT